LQYPKKTSSRGADEEQLRSQVNNLIDQTRDNTKHHNSQSRI
jgi:hypothetical protein